MRRHFLALLVLGLTTAVQAQDNKYVEPGLFNHMNLGVVAGTEGLGVELSMPMGKHFDLRAGFSAMPHVNLDMDFEIETGRYVTDPKTGKRKWQETKKFNQMKELFGNFTGYDIDNIVRMNSHPTYSNVKLLVDFYPFKQRNWHVTAGFYYGNATIGESVNSVKESTTLVGVGIYNNMYEQIGDALDGSSVNDMMNSYLNSMINDQMAPQLRNDILQRMVRSQTTDDPWIVIGDTHFFADPTLSEEQLGEYADKVVSGLLGQLDGYLTAEKLSSSDPEGIGYFLQMAQKMQDYGRIGVYVGNDDEGDPYVMEPDELAMLSAKAKVNRFKPFVGFGYDGAISKDRRFRLGFDCGALFWGGSPKIITHDGTDISRLHNLWGNVDKYTRLIKAFPVMPILNLRLSYTLF